MNGTNLNGIMPTEPIPVALIGCGTVAQYGHLPAIAQTPELKLVAVADANAETARAVATKYSASGYTDYRELLARPDVQGVTVSTQLPQHYEVVAAALKAGKHVFCEKPLTDTPERGDALVELARESGRMLAVNFEYRLDEAMRLMREVLLSGEIGKLQVIRLIHNWSAHGVLGAAGERRARFLQSGGGCLDCGVHFLDLARYLSGSEFEDMSARGQWVEPQFHGPGHMLIQARMQNGALAHLESSFVYTHRSQTKSVQFQYELIGERGVLSWRPHSPSESTNGKSGELQILTEERSEVLRTNSEKQFAATYKSWARSLATGTLDGSGLATGEDGNQATRWMAYSLELAEQERGSLASA
jgi:predicted dehydrogenase